MQLFKRRKKTLEENRKLIAKNEVLNKVLQEQMEFLKDRQKYIEVGNHFYVDTKLTKDNFLYEYLFNPEMNIIKYNKKSFIIETQDEKADDVIYDLKSDEQFQVMHCEKFIDDLFEKIDLKRNCNKTIIEINVVINDLFFKVILVNRFNCEKYDFIIEKKTSSNTKTFNYIEENSILKDEYERDLFCALNKSSKKVIINTQPEFVNSILDYLTTKKSIGNQKDFYLFENLYILKDFRYDNMIDKTSNDKIFLDVTYSNSSTLEDTIEILKNTRSGIMLFVDPTRKDLKKIEENSKNLDSYIIITTEVCNLEGSKIRFTNDNIVIADKKYPINWEI